ncbi:MAG TPA: MarR family transcriptional regulator [Mycobacteriales bacterium]|nr:MarR family transcriptional regulator [Mycobacteriales bacterium]
MTRWLDEDEQRTWRNFLATSELLYAALDRQLQRDAGITHASYIVLAMLSEAPDRSLRMSDLAVKANSSPSRLSHAVARLEARGWVRREPAPQDGRGTVAVLTDAGWQMLADTAPGHVTAVREHLFDQLTPEQVRALGDICATVLDGLDPNRVARPC